MVYIIQEHKAFLADGNDVLYIIASPANNHTSNIYREAYYHAESNEWRIGQFYPYTVWDNVGNKPITNTINSASTASQIPSAKAVFDYACDNYSTTEHVIGTWTDGKPLYQKVMTGTFPTITSGTAQTVRQVIDSNFENGFIKYGWFKTSNNSIQKMIPYTDASFNQTSAQIGGGFPLNQLNVQSASDEASEKDFAIVVCYTKSTDTI